MKLKLVCMLVLGCCFSYGQNLDSMYRQSLEALKINDYSAFINLNKEALALRPSHPTLMYNLAAGYSLADSTKKTYHTLRKLLSWNSKVDFKIDKHFDNLIATPGYQDPLDSLSAHYHRLKQLSIEYGTLDGKRHLEDVLVMDSLLWVTDVYHGELITYDRSRDTTVTVQGFDLPVLALATGSDSNSIWVSTAKLAQSIKRSGTSGRPEILEIDVSDGSIRSRIALPDDFIAGSMVFDTADKLYISNSAHPEIGVVDMAGNRTLRTLPIKEGFSLQGITLDHNRNILYVADYIRGIASIDLTNKYELCWFKSPDFLLKGIDGLTFVGENLLLAIQNNSTPRRIIGLRFNDCEVESVTLLDNNLNTQGEPTNGKFYEGLGFVYISNSQWPHYDENGLPMLQNWEEQKVLRIAADKLIE